MFSTKPEFDGMPMRLWRQFLAEWRLYSRDRIALFWTLAFPVILLLALGTLFEDGGAPRLNVVWVPCRESLAADAALGQAMSDLHLQVQVFSRAAAEARWEHGDTAIQLESTPEGYRMRANTYYLSQARITADLINQAWLVAQANLHGSPPPQPIPTRVESPGHRQVRHYAAFLLPGLLGLNLLSMGLFAVGMTNVIYREQGKFRRLAVTPLPKWAFLLGQISHRLSLVVVQAALMLLVGWIAFGIQNHGTLLDLAAIMAVGTSTFLAIGFALSGFAETMVGYGALANGTFYPLVFLSGVYFTLDFAPRWVQQILALFPLAPFLHALRAVFNDGATLDGLGPGLAVVAAWGVAAYLVALKRFRWV